MPPSFSNTQPRTADDLKHCTAIHPPARTGALLICTSVAVPCTPCKPPPPLLYSSVSPPRHTVFVCALLLPLLLALVFFFWTCAKNLTYELQLPVAWAPPPPPPPTLSRLATPPPSPLKCLRAPLHHGAAAKRNRTALLSTSILLSTSLGSTNQPTAPAPAPFRGPRCLQKPVLHTRCATLGQDNNSSGGSDSDSEEGSHKIEITCFTYNLVRQKAHAKQKAQQERGRRGCRGQAAGRRVGASLICQKPKGKGR